MVRDFPDRADFFGWQRPQTWRDGNWFNMLYDTHPNEVRQFVLNGTASLIYNILVCLLHDRRVNKETVEPKAASKLHKLGIGKTRYVGQRPTTPVITLKIPARVYQGLGGKHHARPRMHYRAGHVRQQPYGKRGAGFSKLIEIEATWVNEDLGGTPITFREYRMRQTTE
jgi:hypothetical protein